MPFMTQSKSDTESATIRVTFDSEPSVASGAEAVKGLRCAPMNSANYQTVRSALDCLLVAA